MELPGVQVALDLSEGVVVRRQKGNKLQTMAKKSSKPAYSNNENAVILTCHPPREVSLCGSG
jgi:hypothetical protein